MDALEPLDGGTSIAERAYGHIRRAILDGSLGPGSHLSVPELAARFGVSRSPIREAVLRLEREGLADNVPNRGVMVVSPDGEDLRQLYDVREVLEGLIARLAAEQATDDERSELTALFDEHEQAVAAGDLATHMQRDLSFHERLAEVARNHWVADLRERLTAQIRLALVSTASKPGNPDRAIEEHRAVLRAVLAGDGELAERRARDHVRRITASLPTPNLSEGTADPVSAAWLQAAPDLPERGESG